jgi:hypothetical protein
LRTRVSKVAASCPFASLGSVSIHSRTPVSSVRWVGPPAYGVPLGCFGTTQGEPVGRRSDDHHVRLEGSCRGQRDVDKGTRRSLRARDRGRPLPQPVRCCRTWTRGPGVPGAVVCSSPSHPVRDHDDATVDPA